MNHPPRRFVALVHSIFFDQLNANNLLARGWDILPGIVRRNREFPMPPINENCQLNGGGSSKVHDCVHCSADSAPGVKYFIDQDDTFSRGIKRDLREIRFNCLVI